MNFPERFSNLPEYAFPRLRALLDHHQPGGVPVAMTIGEPRHDMPPFVGDILAQHIGGFAKYPANDGNAQLLEAIVAWVQRRYGVALTDTQVMALNGTREGCSVRLWRCAPKPRAVSGLWF
jgi:N-succinyldiaminopimelate aminotransferase